jgi:putative endonuclease
MRPARDPRRFTARLGELLAAAWLVLKGYRIAARNWRCAQGEIDLIARRGELLVFVEVKTRTSRAVGAPEEAVTAAKRARLVRLAQVYLSRYRGPTPGCRFDVVAVDASRFPPRLRHLPGAFRADDVV